jgi:hypothetical protein
MPKSDTKNDISPAIRRILSKVFANQATVQLQATVEAVLERLWRTHRTPDQYNILSLMLKCFEEELEKILVENNLQRFAYLAFRTRNMILMVDNHRGDTQSAEIYASKQKDLALELIANPEFFHLVLDFKVHEIEILVNQMNLEAALKRAIAYHDLIQSYKTVWELITEYATADFSRSKISIKAEMGLLRCHLLCATGPIESRLEKSPLLNMAAWIEMLEQVVDSPPDISRLNNYKVMYFLKNGETEKAVAHCLQFYKDIHSVPLKEFDLFWFLRAVNDDLLCKGTSPKQIPNTLDYAIAGAEFQIRKANIESVGHPHDLLWREIALLEYHRGNKSKAAKALAKSRKYFMQGDSQILKYLSSLLDKHHNYINSEVSALELQKFSHKNQWLYGLRQSSPY